jgi:hypothetical protein
MMKSGFGWSYFVLCISLVISMMVILINDIIGFEILSARALGLFWITICAAGSVHLVRGTQRYNSRIVYRAKWFLISIRIVGFFFLLTYTAESVRSSVYE